MSNKEVVSNKQAIALIILFILGEASIFIQGISAKKDIWLAIILALVCALPVIIMFARTQALFPNQNLFDIMETCFGKYFSKVLILIFTLYAFYETVLVLEDLGCFVVTVALHETPQLVVVAVFIAICAYATKQGIEVLGRWGELFVIIPIILIIIIGISLVPSMDFKNLSPILYDGIGPVLDGAFLTWGFPLTYISGFLLIFSFSEGKNSPYKIYILGLLIGVTLLFIMYVVVILVLGDSTVSSLYYPTYMVVSTISIGGFLQRLDVIAAIIYVVGIYVQTNVFFLGTCKGIAKLFGCVNYRFIVLPVALLMLNLSFYDAGSIMEFFEFGIDPWAYFILPFELILPFIIWIGAEIKAKKLKKMDSMNKMNELKNQLKKQLKNAKTDTLT